ncbi:hypothetical protein BWI96_00285 [Siphonobacter sp. SORGH_AS_0500]|nr:hypothetical protein BWI96_00285 [Siphonobacter sp. SORGH_AS_0500]
MNTMKKVTLLFPALVLLASCESKQSEQSSAKGSDAPAYEIKGDSVQSQLCVRPDSLCAKASFTYPVFEGNKALTDSIIRASVAASGYLDGESSTEEMKKASPNTVVKDFVAGFDDFITDQRKRFPNEPILGGAWASEVKTEVIRQTPQLTVVSIFSYNYSGGAHPVTFTQYANFTTNGHRINLSELFKPGYEKTLSTVAEKIFRKQEGLKDGDAYGDRYFFTGNAFALNDNFSIQKEGLLFRYNAMEIKSYAEGPTEIMIPYAELKSIIKSDGLLSNPVQ